MDARRGVFADFTQATAVLTRIPIGEAVPEPGSIAAGAWSFPLVGAGVGGIAALVLVLAEIIGLGSIPAALLAVLAGIAITGALHEDGLADTADGFGGGKDRAQKLAIMRDSRLGTYGACALAASFMLRWSALASLGDPGPSAIALMAAHASARASLPAFLLFVPPARSDGLSAGAGRPPPSIAIAAALLGVLVLFLSFGARGALICFLLLCAAGAGMGWLSTREIGGQTGDVAGALEQVNENVILLAAAVLLKT